MVRQPKSPEMTDDTDYASDSSETLHVTALDALVNVNSFFSGAVFLGITFNNGTSLVSTGAGDPCNASSTVARQLVVFEVISFAFYLLSSLIAQGLKLQLSLIAAKKSVKGPSIPINATVNRLSMLGTAFCTIVGTVFLMLSIVLIIELRLGLLTCKTSGWSRAAAIPLILCVAIGIFIFSATVVYAFLK